MQKTSNILNGKTEIIKPEDRQDQGKSIRHEIQIIVHKTLH